MTILRNLFIAALTLATISPFTLDAMKRQSEGTQKEQQPAIQIEPAFGVGIGQACLHIAQNINPENGFALPELSTYIFSLNSEISRLVDDVAQNCGNLTNLMYAIKR